MFFDNASTTKIDGTIIQNFLKLNEENFYNPGGLYSKGRDSRNLIDNCREKIKNLLGAEDGNVIFTGSATEANNLALFGVLKKNTKKILVSMGEHPSVYNCAIEMKNRGFDVDFINLDKSGKIDFSDLQAKMTKDVDIVSIMHVSNETGAINDIQKICEYVKSINPKCIMHSDGVQAVGKINVNIDELGVDMYTMSAHKIHGMKGVGALYVKKNVALKPINYGGGQEFGLRSGTENIIGIYSLSRALSIACGDLDKNYNYVLKLKTKFIAGLKDSGLDYRLNSFDGNSPYVVSVSFKNCRAETILNMMDDRGIYIGNGSACSSKKSGNRVLDNMGLAESDVRGNLRISFSKLNTEEEVDVLIDNLIDVVKTYLINVNS